MRELIREPIDYNHWLKPRDNFVIISTLFIDDYDMNRLSVYKVYKYRINREFLTSNRFEPKYCRQKNEATWYRVSHIPRSTHSCMMS